MGYELVNKESQMSIYKWNIEVYGNSFRPRLYFPNKFRFMINYDLFPIWNKAVFRHTK